MKTSLIFYFHHPKSTEKVSYNVEITVVDRVVNPNTWYPHKSSRYNIPLR